ncbi:hypothetical protein [Portibacter lacus]|uniref:Uncharacterized protein n=1 Tax=Portibacter lacus TaxID=1099794 RepID=A0AA37SYM3_9BACT|nr:hypothetical protein [Portibacter lacus]GLR19820.1 hypothetical protein GCM10007940_44360 [Portibacter lacus]
MRKSMKVTNTLNFNALRLVVVLFFSFSSCQFAIGQSANKAEIAKVEKILSELGTYATDVLLDEEGKSRCDYNMIEGKWYPYEEPWHTGQIIYGLLEAYRVTNEERFLTAATKAGDWWTSLEIKDHPKLKGMVNAQHADHAGDVIVFATVSDGSAGLFELHKVTKVDKYARVPTQAGAWMLENMCEMDLGLCYDSADPETGEVYKEYSPFHRDKKNQTIKDVARPNNEGSIFLDMYRYTSNEKYKDAFIKLCNSVLETQDEHGLWMDFMPNHIDVNTFHPRFNLWYAESLLNGYDLTGDEKYLVGAKKTVDRYVEAQLESGVIYYENFLDGTYTKNSICGSAVAFNALLMIRLEGYGYGSDLYKERIKLSSDWLIKNQFATDHPDENLRGAIMNIRTRYRKNKHWIVNRDVGSSFGLRFFAAYHDYLQVK